MDTLFGLFGQLWERIMAHHFATQWLWLQDRNFQRAKVEEVFGEVDETFFNILNKN